MTVMLHREFAARHGVSPATVSQWIRRGKLDGPALTGRHHIVVEEAERQLRERLDRTVGRPRFTDRAPAPGEGDQAQRTIRAFLAEAGASHVEMMESIEAFLVDVLVRVGGAAAGEAARAEFRRRFV